MSATSSTGRPVWLHASGACSLTKPGAEQSLPKTNPPIVEPILLPPRGQSPQTVYLDAIGTCSISAAVGEGPVIEVESVSQSFPVAKDPSEQLSFTSTLNSPTVEGTYKPSVRSSAGIELEFAIATPSVCPISVGSLGELSDSVSFVAGGMCTIDVWQAGSSEAEPPEAQQSFAVAKAAQQIAFGSSMPGAPMVGGPNYAVSAGSLMHVPVVVSSKTPSVCVIEHEQTHGGLGAAEGWPSTSAEVSFINAGLCTIAASNEGSPQYVATEAQQSFTVYDLPEIVERPSIQPAEPPAKQPSPQPTAAPTAPASAPTTEPEKKTPTNKKHQARCPAKRSKCATLIVHVYGYGGPAGGRSRGPGGSHVLEGERLRIVKLGASGASLNSVETSKHRVRLTPGRYEVTAETGGPSSQSTKVVVRAGETREVTIKLSIE